MITTVNNLCNDIYKDSDLCIRVKFLSKEKAKIELFDQYYLEIYEQLKNDIVDASVIIAYIDNIVSNDINMRDSIFDEFKIELFDKLYKNLYIVNG